LASKEHAILQTDADVTSFDGGYGLILLKWWDREKLVKFSLGRSYSAQDAMDMGMVNAIPHAELEDTALWAQDIRKSPMAIKMLNLL
jgi:naphthoate synthase